MRAGAVAYCLIVAAYAVAIGVLASVAGAIAA